jgi:hypothetical protein
VGKKGFDLAWVAAFLQTDDDRRRFFEAYGPRSRALAVATDAARAHLARFSPLVEWYGRRWRASAPPRRSADHPSEVTW